MTDKSLKDKLAGARITVDRKFTDRIADSSLSHHQWDLAMTAIDFEIRDRQTDPRLVANTQGIDAMTEAIHSADPRASGTQSDRGIIDVLKRKTGLGSDPEWKEAVQELAAEYASELEQELRDSGRWDEIVTGNQH